MPENQTTAHETELRITSNGKSLDVDYTLEDLPLDFNIKGDTLVNVVWDLKENGHLSLNNLYNQQTLEHNRFRFRDNTGITRGIHYQFLSRKTIFEPNETYTITYHIRKIQGANRIRFNAAGVEYELPREKGIHSFTFNTNDPNFFSWNVHLFIFHLDNKSATDPVDEWDIEILNCVKGEMPCRIRIEGMCSVGSNGGLQIATQPLHPILGEYVLQGDVPSQLEFIENEIDKQVDEYKISWI